MLRIMVLLAILLAVLLGGFAFMTSRAGSAAAIVVVGYEKGYLKGNVTSLGSNLPVVFVELEMTNQSNSSLEYLLHLPNSNVFYSITAQGNALAPSPEPPGPGSILVYALLLPNQSVTFKAPIFPKAPYQVSVPYKKNSKLSNLVRKLPWGLGRHFFWIRSQRMAQVEVMH